MSIEADVKRVFGRTCDLSPELESELVKLIEGGADYECDNPLGGHKWTSKKVEAKCPFCGSKLIGIRLKKKMKYGTGEITHVVTYEPDEV